MLTHDGKVYLGVYPGSSIMSFDPAQEFNYGTNPKILGPLGAGQDRPFAWTAAGGRIVIGSVPNYGQLGGAVTLLDPATGRLTAYRNVVPDHSVTALATVGDLVVGGTSVYGGLGIPPTGADAKLFLYDPVTATKVWEGVPVPGDGAVTALAVAPNGHVFGVTAGKIFEFDPATRTVLRVEQVASPVEPDAAGVAVGAAGVRAGRGSCTPRSWACCTGSTPRPWPAPARRRRRPAARHPARRRLLHQGHHAAAARPVTG